MTSSTRVFPPLGTTDYSSFIQQLPDPDEVDGYFWVVGGTGTNAALEAFVNAKGDLTGDQHAGNLFFSPALASALGPDIAGAYIGGFAAFPGDVVTPEIEAYKASADATWESLASGAAGGETAPASAAAGFGFMYGYYVAGLALVQGLEAVDGDLSDGHAAFREELATMTLEAPYGTVTLDENRQGIIDTFVAQLVLDEESGEVVQKTVAIIPQVDQTFGGTFGPDTPPPSREDPACEAADLPWVGNAIPVVDGVPQTDGATEGSAPAGTEPMARSPLAPSPQAPSPAGTARERPRRRPKQHDDRATATRGTEGIAPFVQLRDVVVAFGGLLALGGVDLDVARGERLAVLGPNGAGKTTLFNVIAGDLHPTQGHRDDQRRRLHDGAVAAPPGPRRRPDLSEDPAVPRPDRRGQPAAGLDRQARQPPLAEPQRPARAPAATRARAAAAAVWLGDRLDTVVGDLSHGQQRQLEVGMVVVTDPELMMLDEPASGLSRGERERLTELLRALSVDTTLLLIEHDMDVALRIAERVVVMADGSVIAEGTPDEIRHDPLVNEVYLGIAGSCRSSRSSR